MESSDKPDLENISRSVNFSPFNEMRKLCTFSSIGSIVLGVAVLTWSSPEFLYPMLFKQSFIRSVRKSRTVLLGGIPSLLVGIQQRPALTSQSELPQGREAVSNQVLREE